MHSGPARLKFLFLGSQRDILTCLGDSENRLILIYNQLIAIAMQAFPNQCPHWRFISFNVFWQSTSLGKGSDSVRNNLTSTSGSHQVHAVWHSHRWKLRTAWWSPGRMETSIQTQPPTHVTSFLLTLPYYWNCYDYYSYPDPGEHRWEQNACRVEIDVPLYSPRILPENATYRIKPKDSYVPIYMGDHRWDPLL